MSYYPDDDSQYSDYTDATEQSAEVRSEEGPKSVGSWSTTSCSSSSSASETSETTRTTATTATTATSYRYANRHLTQPEKQSHSWMDGLWSWYLNDGKGERDRQKDADDDCSSVVTADIAKISLESEIKDHSVRIRGHRDEEISVSCHHRHKDADGDCSSVVAVDITTTNHGSEIRDHSLRVRGHILDKGNSISESEKRGDSTYKKLKRKTTKKDRYDTHDDCDDLSQATVDSGNVASNYVQRKYRNRSRVSREERDDRSLGEKQNEVNAGSSDSVASKHSRKKNWVQSLVPIAEGDNKSRGEPNQNFNADESDSIVPKYSRRKKRARPRVSKAEEDDRSLGDQSQELTAGHSDSVEPNYSQRLNKVISLVSRIERNDRSLLAEQQKKRSWQNPFGHKAKELPPRPARITGIHQRHHPSSTKKINERPSSSTSTGGPVEPNSIDLIPNHAAASQPRLLGAGEKFAYPKLAVDFISNVPTEEKESRSHFLQDEASATLSSHATLQSRYNEHRQDAEATEHAPRERLHWNTYSGSSAVFHTLSSRSDIERRNETYSRPLGHPSMPSYTMSMDRYDSKKAFEMNDDDTDTDSVVSTVSKLISRIREATFLDNPGEMSMDRSHNMPW